MKNRSILLGCLGARPHRPLSRELLIPTVLQVWLRLQKIFQKNRNLGLYEWPNRKWYVIQNLGK